MSGDGFSGGRTWVACAVVACVSLLLCLSAPGIASAADVADASTTDAPSLSSDLAAGSSDALDGTADSADSGDLTYLDESDLFPGWGEDGLESPDPSGAQSTVVASSLSRRLDAYMSTAWPKTHVPGMAVAVVGRDGVIWSDTEGDCGSTSEPFVIGSLSKSYTAVGVMQLVEQGKVDLDADVTLYVPELDLGAPVSVRQLLNQTSGLGGYQSVNQAHVVSEQGAFSYANVNYDLLGKVIERVSGQSYSTYMSENVFEPLGLTNTYASLQEAVSAGLVPGHRSWFGATVADGFVHTCDDDAWGQEPSGYISSSLSDMCSYLQMYLDGGEGVLSGDSIRQMFSSNVYDEGSDTYYGMGWTTYDRGGELVQSHDGQVENYTASMCILPERGIAVVLLADLNDTTYGNYATFTMMSDIITLAMGEDPVVAADETDAAVSAGDGSADAESSDMADESADGGSDDSIQAFLFGTTLADADSGEYLQAHLGVDVSCLVYLVACGWQVALCRRWARKMSSEWGTTRGKVRLAIAALVHVLLPIVLLAAIPEYLGIEWVELVGFVPDAALVIILGSALLVLGGILRLVLWRKASSAEMAA